MHRRCIRLIVALAFCCLAVPAQMGPSLGDSVPYPWYSGVQQNPTQLRLPAAQHVVSIAGASWVRVFFSDITLGADDRIVITGLLDGARQSLDRIDVKKWGETSAYFNGDTVTIELIVAPGSSASYEITRVARGAFVVGGIETLCGADNRTPSSENPVCRILTSATSSSPFGSGFLVDAGGCMLTAGHVVAAWGNTPVAEFNVPFSTAAGNVVHPGPQDQYPVDMASVVFVNGAIGDDWAVCRLFNDPAANQGFMNMATSLPAVNTTLRITGCGTDSTPNQTYNGIQQTDTGPYTAFQAPSELRYRVDTTGGVSGSPVRINSNDLVIGIHTNGGCTATGGFNSGTSLFNPGLQAAIGTVCGFPPACSSITLGGTTSQPAGCSPLTANFTITPAAWNVVAVSSTSDWDLTAGGVSSVMAGPICDYLIQDGRAGGTAISSATLTRVSGNASCQAQYAPRQWATLNSTTTVAWGSSQIVQIIEVSIITPGNYDITIGGAGLNWALFAPTTNAWMPSTTAMTTGTAGGGTVTVPGLNTGVYAIVISRDGGVGTPVPNPTVNVSSGAPTCPANIATPAGGYSLDCGTQLTRQWTLTSAAATSGGSWSIGCTQGNLPASWLSFVGTPTSTTADVRVTVPPCTPAGVYSCPDGLQWTGTCVGTPNTTLTAAITVTVANCAAANGPTASPTASPNPVCAGQPTVITANANNASSYSWTFPSGTPASSTAQNPTVTFAAPGTYNCTLTMNGTCTGTSSTVQIPIIVGPAMNVAAISPSTGDVTGGTFVTITGSGFTGASGARIGGASCTGFTVVSNTQITCCVPPSAAGALPADVVVEQAACSASLSGGFTYTGSAPVVTLLTPATLAPTTQQVLLTIDGSGFTPTSVAHIDRQPIPTSWITSTQLVAVVPAGMASGPAGLTLEVADGNFGAPVSNPVVLPVGTQNNVGVITVSPLAFNPGDPITARLGNLTPTAPLTLVLEPAPPTPITGFPTAADDNLLAVGSSMMFPLLDGLGIFLPPNPANAADACGVFTVNGNALNPAANVTVRLQAAYIDPSAPAGFRLTWAHPLGL